MKRHQHQFFTSDHHFGHPAVIEMCGRPFYSVEDMNRSMIEAWNSVVKPNDIVWHLGDFAYKSKPLEVREIFDALNGIKFLIRGNHDKQMTEACSWAGQADYKHVVVDGQRVNLSHYAMRSWPAMHRKSYMLFGHSHGSLPGSRYTIDVGVDSVGYQPQTLAELRARMDLLPRLAFDVGRVIEDHEPKSEVSEGMEP